MEKVGSLGEEKAGVCGGELGKEEVIHFHFDWFLFQIEWLGKFS